MTFAEAHSRRNKLAAQLRAGTIDRDAYVSAVNALRIQDAEGRHWQPDPYGEGWLCWDGVQWQAATPPAFQAMAAPPKAPPASAPPTAGFMAALKSVVGGHVLMRLIDPHSFVEVSRNVPASRRPQEWWDMLSILGGAVAGYLWFLYSSVRGLTLNSTLRSMLWSSLPASVAGSTTSLLNMAPTLILIVLPFILFFARKKVMAWQQALVRWLPALPAGSRVVFGIVAAVLAWLVVSSDFFIFQRHEGVDYITPFLMTAIPFGIAIFRGKIDKLLAPFQPLQRKIPQGILFGVGLGVPFLTAYALYHGWNLKEYPLMRTNVVIGTLLSYMIVRRANPSGTPRGGLSMAAGQFLFVTLFLVGLEAVALADDFLRDPFNLNDGLRTTGWGPVLAGVPTAVVTMLVNGQQVAQTIIQGEPVKPGEEAPRKDFQVTVETKDKAGTRSTTVYAGEDGHVLFYAHCEKEGGRFPAGDPTIRFTLVSGTPYIQLIDEGMQGGERCARVKVVEPAPPSGSLPQSCSVHVSAGADGLIGYTVDLKVADMELEFF